MRFRKTSSIGKLPIFDIRLTSTHKFLIGVILVLLFLKVVIWSRNELRKYKSSSTDTIHIVMCYDVGEYNLGMKALVNSVLKNTRQSHRLYFHFIAKEQDKEKASKYISDLSSKFRTTKFDVTMFHHWPQKENLFPGTNRFKNILNLSRIYLVDLFPQIEKIISMDTDMILNEDIARLWDESDTTRFGIAAPRSDTAKIIGSYLHKESVNILKGRVNFDPQETVFGCGLFVTNLSYWRQNNIVQRIEDLLMLNNKTSFIENQTLKKSLINLVFHKNFFILKPHWNANTCSTKEQEESFVIHFSGFQGKPWDSLSVCSTEIRNLWFSYFFSNTA